MDQEFLILATAGLVVAAAQLGVMAIGLLIDHQSRAAKDGTGS